MIPLDWLRTRITLKSKVKKNVPVFQQLCVRGDGVDFFSFRTLLPPFRNRPIKDYINEQGEHLRGCNVNAFWNDHLGYQWTAILATLFVIDYVDYRNKGVLTLLERDELDVTLQTEKGWNALHMYLIRYNDKTDKNLVILDRLVNHKSATNTFLNQLNSIGDTPLDVGYKVLSKPYDFVDGDPYYMTHDQNNNENSSNFDTSTNNAGESSKQKIIAMLRAKGCKRSSEL